MNNNDEEKAWRLWHLLQEVSDVLWDRHEPAFLDFCMQENERNGYLKTGVPVPEDDLPF